MHLKNILGITVCASVLVACGGDSDDSSSTSNASSAMSSAEQAYSGSRDDAAVTNANAGNFPRSAFAARDYSLNGSRAAVLLSNKVGGGSIDNSAACENGGQVTDKGKVDASSKLGSITTTFSNCLVSGVVFDGSTHTDVSGYDTAAGAPTAWTVNFNSLKLTHDGKTATVVGSFSTDRDLAAKTAHLTFKTFLKAGTGEEVLTDMQSSVMENDKAVTSTLDGTVCVGHEGCTQLQTTAPFVVDYNGGMQAGELIASGANNSKAQMQVLNHGGVQLNVDANGDGVYGS